MTSRRAIAYHEAGHAVAGLRFGWTVERVSIVPDGDSDGRVEFGSLPSIVDSDHKVALYRQRLVERMVVNLAGPAAQRRAAPGSRIPAGARVDHDRVDQSALLLSSTPQGERALRRYAEAEARALVHGAWPIIAAVAAGLVERGTLSGAELDSIIEPIDAARAMEVRAHLSAYGLPTDEQVDQARAECIARSRTVERRHVAEAVLRSVLRRIGMGDQTPLSADDLDAAVRQHAATTGLDPDIAARRLWAAHSRQADALRWRTVEPTMALTSTRRH